MSDLISIAKPIIEQINDPQLTARNVSLDMLRLDNIHPLVNGNKWFKLKLNLQAAMSENHGAILSFGGAYSNHIHALAAASSLLNISSIGVIRGELPSPLNPILQFAQDQGMHLHAVSRSDYRLKQTPGFIAQLTDQFGEFYLVPEGGSNELGVTGCEEIVKYLIPPFQADEDDMPCYVAVACGTGATLAGLIRGAGQERLAVNLLGISVLKGAGFLQQEVESWLENSQTINPIPNWQLELDYHCGGYARKNAELTNFIKRFKQVNQISIEPVYTGKLLYGIYDLIANGKIPQGSRVIAVHSGGVHEA